MFCIPDRFCRSRKSKYGHSYALWVKHCIFGALAQRAFAVDAILCESVPGEWRFLQALKNLFIQFAVLVGLKEKFRVS